MGVVGPRMPIASDLKEYKLSHLRRLDVHLGSTTGLWRGRAARIVRSKLSLARRNLHHVTLNRAL
jgi:hypothetical protein